MLRLLVAIPTSVTLVNVILRNMTRQDQEEYEWEDEEEEEGEKV